MSEQRTKKSFEWVWERRAAGSGPPGAGRSATPCPADITNSTLAPHVCHIDRETYYNHAQRSY